MQMQLRRHSPVISIFSALGISGGVHENFGKQDIKISGLDGLAYGVYFKMSNIFSVMYSCFSMTSMFYTNNFVVEGNLGSNDSID